MRSFHRISIAVVAMLILFFSLNAQAGLIISSKGTQSVDDPSGALVLLATTLKIDKFVDRDDAGSFTPEVALRALILNTGTTSKVIAVIELFDENGNNRYRLQTPHLTQQSGFTELLLMAATTGGLLSDNDTDSFDRHLDKFAVDPDSFGPGSMVQLTVAGQLDDVRIFLGAGFTKPGTDPLFSGTGPGAGNSVEYKFSGRGHVTVMIPFEVTVSP